MSLMAGFDFVAEISNATLLKMIKSDVKLGGIPLNPDFELTLPFTGGSAHLVVDDIQLDLNDDDTATLGLVFINTSATIDAPVSRVVCPLAGTINIKIPVTLVNASGSKKAVALNMSAATVSIAYTSQADQAIAQDLSGTPVTPAQFKALALTAITNFVKATPSITTPISFKVVPGSDGSLDDLQFSSLQVHCIGNASRSKQALGIFGNFLTSTQGNGNHAQKTTTAIPSGDDMTVSISPGAFRKLIFCPTISDKLNVAMNKLPTACGNSSGVNYQGVTIKSITDSFTNGHINVNGSVAKSGFCYDANGSFHAEINLSLNGNKIHPTVDLDTPDVSIDVPWYCYLAVGLVLGPIEAAILGIIDAVIDGIVSDLAGSLLGDAIGDSFSDVSLSGFSGAVFTGVGVTTEGITIRGLIPLFPPVSQFYKHVWLDGSVTTSNKSVLSSGTYHTKIFCQAEAKDYPYTEYAQKQTANYDVEAELMATPLTAVYTVRSIKPGSAPITLTGTSGTIAVPDVDTTYMTPLATGGTKVTQTIHLDYTLNGTHLKLKNKPDEGNFSVYLTGQFTECSGATVPAQNRTITFVGDNVEFGGTYYEDYQECVDKLRDSIDKLTDKYKPQWKYVPIWVKVNYPAPEDIYSQIEVLTEAGVQVTEDLLLQSRLAHGAAFARAISGDAETKLGRAVVRSKVSPQLKTQASQLTAQIASLTRQLDAVTAVQLEQTNLKGKRRL